MTIKPKYKRAVLKLSGEALRENGSAKNISVPILADMARQIQEVVALGVELAIVIGGGNFWRGVSAAHMGMDRSTADYVGMLATVMNGLALGSQLESLGVPSRVVSALELGNIAETFVRRKTLQHLEEGRVVIFVAGTGNPFFSTDTAAALRASEIAAEVILKATKVDGIYTADPLTHPDATKYDTITYQDALTQQLRVLDGAAFSLCMESGIPIIVFDMLKEHNIRDALMGEKIGTLVTA